jgi:uncharacterized membrane protein
LLSLISISAKFIELSASLILSGDDFVSVFLTLAQASFRGKKRENKQQSVLNLFLVIKNIFYYLEEQL